MSSLFQSVPMAIILLLIGFVLLIKGADIFVEGSSNVAQKLKVPSIIIGLTIVAMGTSLPETAVSVLASISGNNALAISNAVGSNIFNLMVVLGCSAVIAEILVPMDTIKRDFPFSIFCALLLLVFAFFGMILGRVDGILLLLLFTGYIVTMIFAARKARNENKEEESEDLLSAWKCILYIAAGMAGIAIGAQWVVDGATTIAAAFGLSQTLIGLTIVSMGTSLPELVTSVVAARKKEVGLAVGNAIGSNVFNILMVLGVASAISPIPFYRENIIDTIILVVFSILVWILAWTKKKLARLEGCLMLAVYFVYLIYIIMR